MVLTIELQDNLWVYAPGETIIGKVVIDKSIWNKVEGLTLRFCGRIEVGVNNGGTSGIPAEGAAVSNSAQPSRLGCAAAGVRRLTNRVHPLEDILLDHTINLIHNWKVLKPGRHEFDFNYTLPADLNLPSSVKVKGARIHYEFVTTVKRPRDDFKVYQTPFYICPPPGEYHRENFAEFLNPIERRIQKNVSFLGCCRGGTMKMELKLQRRLCTVGERFSFVVNVWNELKRSLDAVSVRLVREFKYKKSPYYKTKEIISEIIGPSLISGESQIWNGFLQIPSNTPGTSVTRRDCFELNYFFKVVVHPFRRPSNKLSIKFPVILLPPNALRAVSARPSAPPMYSPDGGDDTLPPPTYEEATHQPIFNEDEASTSHLFATHEEEK